MMKTTRLVLFLLITACIFSSVHAQKYSPDWKSLNQRGIPSWFHQDKFGIFIHWGVYAVPSYAPVIPNSGYSYAEWYWYRLFEKQKDFIAFHEKNYPGIPYEGLESQFKAEMFNPDQWAEVFKKSGAKYVVLTSKHHEGYCLWPNKEADRVWGRPWNAVTGTPKRDLLGDLTNSVRAKGLKMGYYYSLYEWFNPLWKTDKKKFVQDHLFPQFKDLVTRYKPSIIFSDGEWDLPDSVWRSPELLAWLFNESPVAKDVVVNDRWGSNTREKNNGCTYTTSEYGSGMDANVVWEESQGIGHSYGYNRNEQLSDYKSSHDLILMLCDIVSRGGNLLLDIGPTADGRIPVIMQQRLADIGSWLAVNGEAIYGTDAYKNSPQWTDGIKPQKKGASFMAGYSVARMVMPKKDSAYIECFYTQKGKVLYAIVPGFRPSLKLKNMNLSDKAAVTLLGSGKVIARRKEGADTILDLSKLQPGDVSETGIFVVKISEY